MKLTVLVENTSNCSLQAEHGLSLFIEHNHLNFLFDMGQKDLFKHNAELLQIPIEKVDFAIISHSHYDHGGGLSTFLDTNHKAKIYLRAFEPCYSKKDFGMKYIGLDEELKKSHRLIFCSEKEYITPEIILFSNVKERLYDSSLNNLLFLKKQDLFINDTFDHEQNLIIKEGKKNILIAGCAHTGIINIINKAEAILGEKITDVVGGFHLKGLENDGFIKTFAEALKKYPCNFYTCHCTGTESYLKLKEILGNQIQYLSCGMNLTL